jgi:UDP:flavonoid glycosyltransferase YjiC (YdhE family)
MLREHPPYSLGARMPRTPAGRALWRGLAHGVDRGLERGRAELNAARAELGLPPTTRVHGGISERLCIVATFPQLEYPRDWPPGTHVVGPLLWEPPGAPVEPPPGDAPLILVAPSTSQDPRHTLVRAALAGLAAEPVRVLAATNRRPLHEPLPVPANARVADWVSYSDALPRCALAIVHGGHGTVMRALAEGVPLVACPAAGDMNENAARIDWAGVGVRVPHALLSPRSLRLAVRRALGDSRLAVRARELAAWAHEHDGAERAAELVEQLA